MIKFKLFFFNFIFFLFLGFTSIIKNQTRIIEKDIFKIDKKIIVLKKDLNETQLDYFYLSSPINLNKKIKELDLIEYVPMDYSKIYLNYDHFINSKKKITILKSANEKETKKK